MIIKILEENRRIVLSAREMMKVMIFFAFLFNFGGGGGCLKQRDQPSFLFTRGKYRVNMTRLPDLTWMLFIG